MAQTEAQAKRAAELEMKRGNVEKAQSILQPFINTEKSMPTTPKGTVDTGYRTMDAPAQTVSPTQNIAQTQSNDDVKAKFDQAVASGATSQVEADKAYQLWLKQNQQPVAPAKVEQVKAEPVKTQTTDRYKDDSPDRQAEIINNLNQYSQTNPELFQDERTFKDFFAYNKRSEKQKQMLDNYYLRVNKPVVFDKFGQFSVGDIANGVVGNTISQAELSELYGSDPVKYNAVLKEIEKLRKYENANNSLADKLKTTMEEFGIGAPDVDIDLQAEYDKYMGTPEIKEKEEKLASARTEIELIEEKIFDMRDTIKAQYEGTGMTSDVIDAIVADRSEALSKELRRKQIQYNGDILHYQTMVADGERRFGLVKQQYELDRQKWTDKMQALGFSMSMFQQTPEGVEYFTNLEYQAKNPDIDSKDPVTARRALSMELDKYYQQFGDIIQRPQSRVVNDIIEQAQREGISLSEALQKNFIDFLQKKPEYKSMIRQKYGLNSSQSIQTIGDKPYIVTTNADGSLSFKPFVFVDEGLSVKINDYTYKKIDLGNGQVVGVGQTVNFNGTDYTITQLGGSMTGGIDLYSSNKVIGAFEGGTVAGQGVDKSGNRFIEILGDNGYVYRYNHLKEAGDGYQSFAVGARVEQGQQIGIMGNTGNVRSGTGGDGTHLDLAVYSGERATNKNVNPLNIVDQTRILFGVKSKGGADTSSDIRGLNDGQYSTLKGLGLDDVDANIVAGIYNGTTPPMTQARMGMQSAKPIVAGLNAIGYDAATALMDWQEMSRLKATLSSVKFKNLEASVMSLAGSVGQAERLYRAWEEAGKISGIRVFNDASLRLAADMPGEAGVAARSLKSHIDDMKSELAKIYMLGNSPTEASLEQANRSIQPGWNKEQFFAALQLIEENIRIKENSLKHLGHIEGNIYSKEIDGLVDIYTGEPINKQVDYDEQMCVIIGGKEYCW